MTGQVPSLEDRSSSSRARNWGASWGLPSQTQESTPWGREESGESRWQRPWAQGEEEREKRSFAHLLSSSMIHGELFLWAFYSSFLSGQNDGPYLTELSWGLHVIACARHRVCSQWMLVVVTVGRDGDCGTSLKTGKFHHKIESSPDNLGYRTSEREPHFYLLGCVKDLWNRAKPLSQTAEVRFTEMRRMATGLFYCVWHLKSFFGVVWGAWFALGSDHSDLQ